MSFSREPVNAELWLRQRENISRNLLAVIYIKECQEAPNIYHKPLLDHVWFLELDFFADRRKK